MSNARGHWLCQRHLGAGSFGVVQLWQNDCTGEMIAVKKCRFGSEQLTEKQKERWINEVRTMNSTRHSNIVATRDVPVQLAKLQDPLPILCTEYCSRGDLRAVLDKTVNCCGIEEGEALRIMEHVSSAVEYLHSQNFTHRDLKPENIVLADSGEKTIYKLADLGYVCELGETTLDRSVVGTMKYLAPEIFWRNGYTCSVDYWSLGILFYEIITGNTPFLHANLHEIPTWIERVKKKNNRHISAREEEGRVIFSEEIEDPTTISESMRSLLTGWFRVVLQWDPTIRGRIKDESGNEKFVVFSLLKSLLSWKIFYIFAVHLYRIDSYAVNPRIKVHELRILIRDKTGIEVTDQIVCDFNCNIISEANSAVLDCTKESKLLVFHKGNVTVKDLPAPKLSQPIRRMIQNSREILDRETIRRYYAAAVFFIDQERELFRSYIVALSIHADLSNMMLENFGKSADNLSSVANNLVSDITTFIGQGKLSEDLDESVRATGSTIQMLVNDTERLNFRIKALTNEFDDLHNLSKTNWLEKWDSLYEKAKNHFDAILNATRMRPGLPVAMVKLLYEALKLREEQLKTSINSIVIRCENFDKEITQLRTDMSHTEGRIDNCRKVYEDIVKRAEIEERDTCSFDPNDTVIMDNVVLQAMIRWLDRSHSSNTDIQDPKF